MTGSEVTVDPVGMTVTIGGHPLDMVAEALARAARFDRVTTGSTPAPWHGPPTGHGDPFTPRDYPRAMLRDRAYATAVQRWENNQ